MKIRAASNQGGRVVTQSLIEGRHVEGRPYLPGIDGLRALAVMAVMLFHLIPSALPGGFIGVDVFFVISGFVVTGSMMRDAKLPFGKFITAFYARRFRRIVPALVACLCVTVLFSVALIPDAWLSHALRDTGLSAFFGLSNFALVATNDGYFATRSEFNPFTHTWSLAVEEQFYLLFPLMLYISIHRTAAGWAGAGRLFIAILCIGSLIWCAWATSFLPSLAYYMLPSRFWELGLGAIAYLLGDRRRGELIGRFGQTNLMALGAALVTISAVAADPAAFPFPWALPAVVGSFLLLISVSTSVPKHIGGRLIASKPMIMIGLLSYSLYLWHWPIYTIMRWTIGLESVPMYGIALSLTAICAYLSYRLVELPTQRHRLATRLSTRGTVGAGLLLVILGWALSTQIYDRPWIFKQTVVAKNSVDWYPYGRSPSTPADAPCDVRGTKHSVVLTVLAPVNCKQDAVALGSRLFVIGDSHAGAYDRLLDTLVRLTGFEVHRNR